MRDSVQQLSILMTFSALLARSYCFIPLLAAVHPSLFGRHISWNFLSRETDLRKEFPGHEIKCKLAVVSGRRNG